MANPVRQRCEHLNIESPEHLVLEFTLTPALPEYRAREGGSHRGYGYSLRLAARAKVLPHKPAKL